MRILRRVQFAALLCVVVGLAALPAVAAELYVNAQLGISGGSAQSGGTTLYFANTGEDSDSSPLYGGSLGYAFPLSEMLPRGREISLPDDFFLRVELEGMGGRDYEFATQGGGVYLTNVQSWSVMSNLWLDLPVHAPVSWALGRVPLLDPMSVYLGAGVGIGFRDISTTNNVLSGGEDTTHLAWQAGAGFGYRLADRVTVHLGYRYFDLGNADFGLRSGPTLLGNYTLDLGAHEFISGLRVEFYSIASPEAWRLPGR